MYGDGSRFVTFPCVLKPVDVPIPFTGWLGSIGQKNAPWASYQIRKIAGRTSREECWYR